eukprot:TRINITY_DN16943_c0_g1_i1.p1 TRINITY_DN16943_c0_g1~~TRINITY_DN16943_c0_g1_i1.p1  ORF type:complete len:144 (-),score=20.60 TRINITY_DN16943_c0_g1_i1:109-540(-)
MSLSVTKTIEKPKRTVPRSKIILKLSTSSDVEEKLKKLRELFTAAYEKEHDIIKILTPLVGNEFAISTAENMVKSFTISTAKPAETATASIAKESAMLVRKALALIPEIDQNYGHRCSAIIQETSDSALESWKKNYEKGRRGE